MANYIDIFPTYGNRLHEWHILAGGSGFGNADVDVLLKDAAGGPDQFDNVGNLKEALRLIRQFMVSDQGRAVTAPQNQPGGYAPEGHPGMYIKLSDNEIYETWGDHQGDLGPDRKKYFGGADLRVALAKGISKEAIVTKLEEKNLEWLKPGSGNEPISKGGKSEGIYTFLVGEDASTIYGESSVEPIPGAGGSLFGNVDYFKNLERLWDQSGQDPSVLHEYREDVLDFLATENNANVHVNNRPPSMGGKTTGMWQQINDHKRRQETGGSWGSDDVKITPWFGGQGESERTDFTEADRLAAIAGGHTSYDIYRHLHANPDQRSSSAAAETYKNVRTNLINMQPEYSEYNSDNWRQRMENPIWYEIGVHINKTDSKHAHRTWVDINDYRVLRDYIRESLGSAGIDMPGHKNSASDNVRFTEEHLAAIVGDIEGSPTGYEAGEYWSQWGVEGPPDLPDQTGDSDLTWIQKMVAASGIHSVDSSDWEEKMEYLENRFLDEMFEGRPDGSDVDDPYGPRFKDASDEWGLDIMRLDDEGQALKFDDAHWDDDTNRLHSSSDEWYETLTRGNIDWAFYQDSSIYQEAKKQLGLKGTFSAGSLGVAGIREANVWVHGQQTVMPSDDDILKSWVKYKAKPLPEPYTPKDLTITGYTPDKPKGLAPVPDNPTAPNINIPDVKIQRPSNLDPKLGKTVGE